MRQDVGREVSGKIMLDGRPLPSGQIVLEPQAGGKIGVAQISEGSYRMPAERGPALGHYKVRITARRPTGRRATPTPSSADDVGAEIYQQYLPDRYNVRSELTAEIGQQSPVTLDFELHSQ